MSDSCDLMDGNLPDSSVHEIFPARILEWVVISFSGDLSDPGIKPVSLALAGRLFTAEPPGRTLTSLTYCLTDLTNV